MSPAQAMSAAAKSWREHGKKHSAAHMKVMKEETAKGKSFSAAHEAAMKQVGKGARTSKRQSNAMLGELDSLPVPKTLPKGRAKRSKAAAAIQIENCRRSPRTSGTTSYGVIRCCTTGSGGNSPPRFQALFPMSTE